MATSCQQWDRMTAIIVFLPNSAMFLRARFTMKITAIETMVLRIPFTTGGSADADPWGGKAWTTADALLVKVTTDADIVGWGEAFGYNVIPATRAAIDHMIAPLCVGRDPLSIESLMLELQQKLHI